MQSFGGFSLKYFNNGDRELKILGIADKIDNFPQKILKFKVILLAPVLQEINFDLIELREKFNGTLFLILRDF